MLPSTAKGVTAKEEAAPLLVVEAVVLDLPVAVPPDPVPEGAAVRVAISTGRVEVTAVAFPRVHVKYQPYE